MSEPTDKDKKAKIDPYTWGSEPIRGLNYDYLDITEPPTVEPVPVMPETNIEFSSERAQDFYQRTRGKIVAWAKGAGAGKDVTNYILLVPDIVALMARLMQDPQVAGQIKAEIAAASAYIIVPIDLMPEAMLGPAGLIDDAIVGMYALNRLVAAMGSVGEDKLRQYWDGEEDILVVMNRLLTDADKFVSGKVWTGIKKFMSNTFDAAKSSSSPRGPVIEGSARPIIPPGSPVQSNTGWQSGNKADDDDQSSGGGSQPRGYGPEYDR